ncbi:MFS transporter [Streptomyces sp. NPDC057963]|uniref:MFS transporter n=1 Tax=Streptomyces sp. NPDC057963 TaxID=3346290 RepID=UPI0036E437B1
MVTAQLVTAQPVTAQPAPWHRPAVLVALMPAAFTFTTAENLPIGLLELISEDLRMPLSAVGYLVTGYGVTVAVASVPLAHVTRAMPRRHELTGLLAALIASGPVAALATSYWLLLAARLLGATHTRGAAGKDRPRPALFREASVTPRAWRSPRPSPCCSRASGRTGRTCPRGRRR